ncbi:MAG TPA: HlyD family efflux transporter periplasmic adaptor subunit [Nitrospirales bacterium]|nr:HlyD family efflux transporter periplasmic adaptor subunit [Nitrospirales bacterium]
MDLTPIPVKQTPSQVVFPHKVHLPRVPDRHTHFESWAAVKIPKKLYTGTRILIGFFLVFILILVFVPWTQTIKAQGQLSAYSPAERPQEIHAPLEGRILTWHVNEGMAVKKQDLLLDLVDVDSKFLAPDLLTRLDESIQALEERRETTLARADFLGRQLKEMTPLTEATTRSAESRVQEASRRIQSMVQRQAAAKVAAQTAQLNLQRSQILEAEGLLSRRELELAIQAEAAAQAERKASDAAFQEVSQSRLALTHGRVQIEAELGQRILNIRSQRAAALGEAAQASKELADLALTRSNAAQRRTASRITAPMDGTVVRMARVGAGEIVKQGDSLFTIVPDTATRAVEMWAEPLDAPLLRPGRKVRLMFHGIPTIPLPSWPELMAGTFDGTILVVDQTPDSQKRFRFWVVQDPEAAAWPPQSQVRQGTQVMGWVLLNRVPLWYELWRRVNLFPADYQGQSTYLPETFLPKAGRPGK